MASVGVMVVGGLVLALTFFDIIATVLHPQAESPLSSRFQRSVWRTLTIIQRVVGPCKAGCKLLNWGLPLMIAGLIATWLVLLTLGFALLYYPWLGDPQLFNVDVPSTGSLLDAIYYSGVTLATLGYGDIQPIHPLLRLLAIAQAAIGAITISFAVAYVLAVYPALSYVTTIAVALDAEVGGRADALPMVRRYISSAGDWNDALAGQLRELGLELLQLTESHTTHPVLYYAHPQRVQHSFLRVLVTAQGLVGTLRYGLSPDRHGDLVDNPQLLLLEQSLHYSLRKLADSLHIPSLEQPDVEAEREGYTATFDALCDDLQAIGLVSARSEATKPVPVLIRTDAEAEPDEELMGLPVRKGGGRATTREIDLLDPALDLRSDSALDAYVTFRLQTDLFIAAYAAAAGYALEAARADYTTTWWVGGR